MHASVFMPTFSFVLELYLYMYILVLATMLIYLTLLLDSRFFIIHADVFFYDIEYVYIPVLIL